MLFDLPMAWNRLTNLRDGTLIPVMLTTVANKHAAQRLDFLNQITSLHALSNSPCRLTHGISPLTRSSYKLSR